MNPRFAAELSRHCYKPYELEIPEGYEVLTDSDKALKDNQIIVDSSPEYPVPVSPIKIQSFPSREGYYGVAYREKMTGNIIIGHSGTKDINDIAGDIKIAFKKMPTEHKYAIKFHEYINEHYVKHSPHKLNIIHVGHSKGGVNGQLIGAYYNHVIVYTFDSPGINEMLPLNMRQRRYDNITNYVMPENIVNRCNTRIGKTHALKPTESDRIKVEKEHVHQFQGSIPSISTSLGFHKIDCVINAIRENSKNIPINTPLTETNTMPNKFKGGKGLKGFHKLVHHVMMKNELKNSENGYELSNAGIGKSGYSFGGNQLDLSSNEYARSVLKDILCKQYNTNSNNNRKKIESILNTVNDHKKLLTNDDINFVNMALQSKYGKEKIDEAYRKEIPNKIEMVNGIIKSVENPSLKEALQTPHAKLLLIDFCNQFGKPDKMTEYLVKGKFTFKSGRQVFLSENIGAADIPREIFKFLENTKYYQSDKGGKDILRRYNNVNEVMSDFLKQQPQSQATKTPSSTTKVMGALSSTFALKEEDFPILDANKLTKNKKSIKPTPEPLSSRHSNDLKRELPRYSPPQQDSNWNFNVGITNQTGLVSGQPLDSFFQGGTATNNIGLVFNPNNLTRPAIQYTRRPETGKDWAVSGAIGISLILLMAARDKYLALKEENKLSPEQKLERQVKEIYNNIANKVNQSAPSWKESGTNLTKKELKKDFNAIEGELSKLKDHKLLTSFKYLREYHFSDVADMFMNLKANEYQNIPYLIRNLHYQKIDDITNLAYERLEKSDFNEVEKLSNQLLAAVKNSSYAYYLKAKVSENKHLNANANFIYAISFANSESEVKAYKEEQLLYNLKNMGYRGNDFPKLFEETVQGGSFNFHLECIRNGRNLNQHDVVMTVTDVARAKLTTIINNRSATKQEHFNANYQMAILDEEDGNTNSAGNHYAKALTDCEVGSNSAYNCLAKLYEHGFYENVLSYVNSAYVARKKDESINSIENACFINLAEVCFQNKDYLKSYNYWTGYLKLHPERIDVKYLQCKAALLSNQIDIAESIAKEIVSDLKDKNMNSSNLSYNAHLILASICIAKDTTDDITSAKNHLNFAESIQLNYIATKRSEAEKQGSPITKEAKEELQELQNETDELINQRGFLSLRIQDYKSAYNEFTVYLSKHPERHDIKFQQGVAAFHANDTTDKSEQIFKELLKDKKDDKDVTSECHRMLGHVKRKNNEDPLDEFRLAIKDKEQNYQAHRDLAIRYMNNKQYENARQEFEICEKNSKDMYARANHALMLFKLGNIEEARSMLSQPNSLTLQGIDENNSCSNPTTIEKILSPEEVTVHYMDLALVHECKRAFAEVSFYVLQNLITSFSNDSKFKDYKGLASALSLFCVVAKDYAFSAFDRSHYEKLSEIEQMILGATALFDPNNSSHSINERIREDFNTIKNSVMDIKKTFNEYKNKYEENIKNGKSFKNISKIEKGINTAVNYSLIISQTLVSSQWLSKTNTKRLISVNKGLQNAQRAGSLIKAYKRTSKGVKHISKVFSDTGTKEFIKNAKPGLEKLGSASLIVVQLIDLGVDTYLNECYPQGTSVRPDNMPLHYTHALLKTISSFEFSLGMYATSAATKAATQYLAGYISSSIIGPIGWIAFGAYMASNMYKMKVSLETQTKLGNIATHIARNEFREADALLIYLEEMFPEYESDVSYIIKLKRVDWFISQKPLKSFGLQFISVFQEHLITTKLKPEIQFELLMRKVSVLLNERLYSSADIVLKYLECQYSDKDNAKVVSSEFYFTRLRRIDFYLYQEKTEIALHLVMDLENLLRKTADDPEWLFQVLEIKFNIFMYKQQNGNAQVLLDKMKIDFVKDQALSKLTEGLNKIFQITNFKLTFNNKNYVEIKLQGQQLLFEIRDGVPKNQPTAIALLPYKYTILELYFSSLLYLFEKALEDARNEQAVLYCHDILRLTKQNSELHHKLDDTYQLLMGIFLKYKQYRLVVEFTQTKRIIKPSDDVILYRCQSLYSLMMANQKSSNEKDESLSPVSLTAESRMMCDQIFVLLLMVLAKDPNNTSAHQLLSQTYLYTDEYRNALHHIAKAVAGLNEKLCNNTRPADDEMIKSIITNLENSAKEIKSYMSNYVEITNEMIDSLLSRKNDFENLLNEYEEIDLSANVESDERANMLIAKCHEYYMHYEKWKANVDKQNVVLTLDHINNLRCVSGEDIQYINALTILLERSNNDDKNDLNVPIIKLGKQNENGFFSGNANKNAHPTYKYINVFERLAEFKR